MNLIQFQSGPSIPKFFQQFGIETLNTAILEKALGSQSFSDSHCGEVTSRFVRNIFQWRFCRSQSSLKLSVLIKNTKLSLAIWFPGIYLIRQTWNSLVALDLNHQLSISCLSSWLLEFNKCASQCIAPFPDCFSRAGASIPSYFVSILFSRNSYQSPNRCLASFS